MTKPSDESYVRDLLDRLADERSLRELAQACEKTYHDQWLKADETIRQIAKAVGADPQARDKLVELVTQEARSEERLNTLLRDLASCTPLLDVGSLLDDAISGWRIYRADLWRRLNEWVTVNWLNTLSDIEYIDDRGIAGRTRQYSWDELGLDTQTDEADRQSLIARWAVYQELKPLYDIIDGEMGEAAMPRDVEAEWEV